MDIEYFLCCSIIQLGLKALLEHGSWAPHGVSNFGQCKKTMVVSGSCVQSNQLSQNAIPGGDKYNFLGSLCKKNWVHMGGNLLRDLSPDHRCALDHLHFQQMNYKPIITCKLCTGYLPMWEAVNM
jgi:hypothetical protein